ncbi:hypothetical protein DIS18_14225 [Algibacter marinivivus]|uniref:Uncharacterized protein n=1 Tax=Algibacter marinivivus TaxID=2100723 RepID=A0A2U2X250_9FLAO|nr:hypothetical protein [Algibacter marinivivus]PWH81829.1 hypothetical protein DIS18_14225 [Algibacter marinivivus]
MKISLIKKVWGIVIVLIALTLIYNSKSSYYENKVVFYNDNVNGIITDIKTTRGTKVHYGKSDFFYLEQLEKKEIKVGDSILKKADSDLNVYRKNESGQFIYLTKIKVLKPKNSYFKFFFGL